jgi:hypothetical protein
LQLKRPLKSADPSNTPQVKTKALSIARSAVQVRSPLANRGSKLGQRLCAFCSLNLF